MKEIKCPNCGKVFSVDEEDAIERYKAEQALSAKKEQLAQIRLKRIEQKKDAEIAHLKSLLESAEAQKRKEMIMLLAQRDQEIERLNSIIAQNAKDHVS